MKIWTNEHIFHHNWETVTQSQWRKYPNPHNTAVLGGDVMARHVADDGVLHSHRVVISDWALAPWVQRLIGANRECLAHEYSTVDINNKKMELATVNLTFCSFVSIRERICYIPHPEYPLDQTVMRSETEVTVKGVPLTDYMESIIVNTVSRNAGKGRAAIDWVVDKLANETKNLSSSLDKLKLEINGLRDKVADNLIATAKKSIDELENLHPPMLQAQEITSEFQGSR